MAIALGQNNGLNLQSFTGGFPGVGGLGGLSGLNGNSALGGQYGNLLQQVGGLPTGLNGLTSGATFSPSGSPSFGDSNGNTEQMMQVLNQAMQLLTQFLGQTAQGSGASGGDGSSGGVSPVSAGGSSGGDASGGAAPVSSGTGSASGTGGSAPANNTTDQGEIKGFIAEAAKAYGADANVLTEMARRESSFKTDVTNDWDSNAKKGTPSKGLFQFIEPTFKSMAPKAKAANPQAWANLGEPNFNDWRHQALTAAWAVANGQGSHWSTYKASGGK